jgi:hypothetical protein
MALALKPAMFEPLGKVAKANAAHFRSLAEFILVAPDWPHLDQSIVPAPAPRFGEP